MRALHTSNAGTLGYHGRLASSLLLFALSIKHHSLETVAERRHILILYFVQLVCAGNDLNIPRLAINFDAAFEAKLKVAGVFGGRAKDVGSALGVSLGVCGEPSV